MSDTCQPPYIETTRIVIDRKYNPDYGDDRVCECGLSIIDILTHMRICMHVAAKYCQCYTFVEKVNSDNDEVVQAIYEY